MNCSCQRCTRVDSVHGLLDWSTGEMTKRRIPDVCEEVDTWTKKQGETTDGPAGKSKASSGWRVRVDHAAARLVLSHGGHGP
jgi:hypothetical protein